MNKCACLILSFLYFSLYPLQISARINCTYVTDYQENQKALSEQAIDLASQTPPGTDPISLILDAGILVYNIGKHIYNMTDNDSFICKYEIEGKSAEEATNDFISLLKNNEIIPVYFYDGLTSKFIKKIPFNEVITFWKEGTPFVLPKNDRVIFSEKSLKSTIKYFGFYFPKSNGYILWSVNKTKPEAYELQNYDWQELNKYLK